MYNLWFPELCYSNQASILLVPLYTLYIFDVLNYILRNFQTNISFLRVIKIRYSLTIFRIRYRYYPENTKVSRERRKFPLFHSRRNKFSVKRKFPFWGKGKWVNAKAAMHCRKVALFPRIIAPRFQPVDRSNPRKFREHELTWKPESGRAIYARRIKYTAISDLFTVH